MQMIFIVLALAPIVAAPTLAVAVFAECDTTAERRRLVALAVGCALVTATAIAWMGA